MSHEVDIQASTGLEVAGDPRSIAQRAFRTNVIDMAPIPSSTAEALPAPSFADSEDYAELKDVELGQVPVPDRFERIGIWSMIVVAILMIVGIVVLAVFWNKGKE